MNACTFVCTGKRPCRQWTNDVAHTCPEYMCIRTCGVVRACVQSGAFIRATATMNTMQSEPLVRMMKSVTSVGTKSSRHANTTLKCVAASDEYSVFTHVCSYTCPHSQSYIGSDASHPQKGSGNAPLHAKPRTACTAKPPRSATACNDTFEITGQTPRNDLGSSPQLNECVRSKAPMC